MTSRHLLFEPLRRPDPERVGPYLLLSRLGAGAMGRVYLGRSAAGRLVAVKTIRVEYAEDPDFRARFAQEVAAARRVSGAFTASVVAADPDAQVPWLATAYVPAPSLARLVAACGPLPVPAVRWLAAGCAEALDSIHETGLVHRDLKPSNVLVSQDAPRVIDFGVARATERVQLTTTRGSLGTPAYMAPEQARDTRKASAASDVFSLGSTLLYAATGHAPYQGETVTDILVRLATEPPDLGGLPPELGAVIAGCLRREPADRPTPAELLAELAPDLHDVVHEGPPSLPGSALELMEEYRRRPQPPARVVDGSDADRTLGSAPGAPAGAGSGTDTSGPGGSVSGGSGPGGSAPGGSGPSGSGPDGSGPAGRRFLPTGAEPAVPAGAAAPRSSEAAPGEATSGGVGPVRRRSAAAEWRASPLPAALLAVVAVVAVVALMLVGGLLGAWLTDRRAPAEPTSQQETPGRPPDRGPPPPPGVPEGPSGPATFEVNQPRGDRYSTFVVYGRGWPPMARITLRLAGGPASPDPPTADRRGAFHYVVNQRHEFFPGALPPGVHTVVASKPGGPTMEVTFEVGR